MIRSDSKKEDENKILTAPLYPNDVTEQNFGEFFSEYLKKVSPFYKGKNL